MLIVYSKRIKPQQLKGLHPTLSNRPQASVTELLYSLYVVWIYAFFLTTWVFQTPMQSDHASQQGG